VSFDNPQVLSGLAVFIPLALLTFFHYTRHRRALDVLADLGGEGAGVQHLRYVFSTLFFWVFIGALIIALAGPRWGRRFVTEYRRGVDVVFALDVSRSMDVRDVSIAGIGSDPSKMASFRDGVSRIERAADIAAAVARSSGGIRLGAAFGKGRGILAVPLTHDVGAVLNFLNVQGSVTGRGTNLETLIDAAAGAFQDASPAKRLIILFSDGEALSGSLQAALDRAGNQDIEVTSVALGSIAGGPVPWLESPDEEVQMSFRQDGALHLAAELTGGIYVDGNRPDAAALLSEHIKSLAPESALSGYHQEAQDQRRLFVLMALLALGLSKLFEKRFRVSTGTRNAGYKTGT
jgi:Ca-activated chloride channel family protein